MKTSDKKVNKSALEMLENIQKNYGINLEQLATRLGTSFYTLSRWAKGDLVPSNSDCLKLQTELEKIRVGIKGDEAGLNEGKFSSKGARKKTSEQTGSDESIGIEFSKTPNLKLIERLSRDGFWNLSSDAVSLDDLLLQNSKPAETPKKTAAEGISAGKNTYTYDAHTYHTKVPPQGIAQVIKKYLPSGGLVLDPFSGSGMTGVAARSVGMDVVLNELSPAASFISSCFTSKIDPQYFESGVKELLRRVSKRRASLYTTKCRECEKDTEILYAVWSYKVLCPSCDHEFVLWDECRSYGANVKEHKILSEFDCPSCKTVLKKSRLSRTEAVPVMLGYKCCSAKIKEHDLASHDLKLIKHIENSEPPFKDYYPKNELPNGANLNQPKRHGISSIDKFYTKRNLHAMNILWHEINCVADPLLAQYLSFVFTSLYQRVTRMSEYRFWGGSGNTANFNVPYIFREANVFVTFDRKAKSIHDHLSTTAISYSGNAVVHTGSATSLNFLPDSSVDLIFTDPPFGANINYSEMNILWESWLGRFTDNTNEAIVSKFQKKSLGIYQDLMTDSLRECYRVLRCGHWMVVVFMISSAEVWEAIKSAIIDAGFSIERIDIFDKQHGTFKHFVSDNTAGCDLMMHCFKPELTSSRVVPTKKRKNRDLEQSIASFLKLRKGTLPILSFLHVSREQEVDYRLLYSEFLVSTLAFEGVIADFSEFRQLAEKLLTQNG
jgi:DNA modification methylase